MAEQLHAVFNDNGMIVAVFSNEGLAQTHAAKLRALPQYTPATIEYTVGPVPVDENLLAEPYYSALLQRDNGIFDYLDREIEVDVEDDLRSILPDTAIQHFQPFHGTGYVDYITYGWSVAEARSKMAALMASFREDYTNLDWEEPA